MKVLQVNCVYKKGSTGKIVYEIHKQLKSRGDCSVVCYGRGTVVSEDNVYKTCPEWYAKGTKALAMIKGIMYGGAFFATRKLFSIIEQEKPDIVHLHCLNGNFVDIYKLVSYLKSNRIKTVLTLHAEFMHTGNCGHALDCDKWMTGCGNCPRRKKETGSIIFDRTNESWMRMKKAFEGFGDELVIVSVSPWLRDRASLSPILSGLKHEVVYNGLDCSVFHPYPNKDKLKEKHNIRNERIVFHVSPKFDDNPGNIKGGRFILQLAEKLKNENVLFLVAGNYDEKTRTPENVLKLGQIQDQVKLAEYYSMSDVTVLTSEKETFSMVVAESLCCGTPVVGFKAGAPEQIAIEEYSAFSEFANVDILADNLLEMLKRNVDAQEIATSAKNKYSNITMVESYYKIYRRLFNDQ